MTDIRDTRNQDPIVRKLVGKPGQHLPGLYKVLKHIGADDGIEMAAGEFAHGLLHRKGNNPVRRVDASGSISFLDIGDWEFDGTTSYFINEACKERFLQLVE